MRYAGYIIALLLILTGCSDRLETDLTVAGLETSVRLDISVKPMQSTAPSTKAGYIDPSTQESTQIRDLWVLQFDGTDGSAKMLKAWYYPDYTPSTDIRLLTSTSANTIPAATDADTVTRTSIPKVCKPSSASTTKIRRS